MDVAGVAGEIAKLKGTVSQLKEADKEVCQLVAAMFEALCEIIPEVREGLSGRIETLLQEEFSDSARHVSRAPTLRYGLGLVAKRIEPEA